jgi:hypothetical protein
MTVGRLFTASPILAIRRSLFFGDYSRNEQDEFSGITRAVRHEVAAKPARIRFYRQEFDRSELLREDVFP